MDLSGSISTGALGALALPTHYSILNVDQNASKMMIREAYLRLKSLYNNGGDGLYGMMGNDDLIRQTAELEEAFSVLNDDLRRAEYDRALGLGGATPVASDAYSEGWASAHGLSDVVQTSRSTLRVIKTRATRPDDQATQKGFSAILADHDLGDGATLVKLREMVGVTDVEIQDRTKISLEYIRAMETNRFERLPQVVYVKGFMRSYLKYLCVPNAETLIVAYAARLEAWQQGHK